MLGEAPPQTVVRLLILSAVAFGYLDIRKRERNMLGEFAWELETHMEILCVLVRSGPAFGDFRLILDRDGYTPLVARWEIRRW